MSCWLPDQDSNLDWPVNSRVSCHWTIGDSARGWRGGVTPDACVPHDAKVKFGGAPRNRTEPDLLARETCTQVRAPKIGSPSRNRTGLSWAATRRMNHSAIGLYVGGRCRTRTCDTLRCYALAGRRYGRSPNRPMVPGLGFEPSSPRLQRGAFTRLASQADVAGDVECGAVGENRTRVFELAPRCSAVELRPLCSSQFWCTEQDSNLRSQPVAPDLQSGLVAA